MWCGRSHNFCYCANVFFNLLTYQQGIRFARGAATKHEKAGSCGANILTNDFAKYLQMREVQEFVCQQGREEARSTQYVNPTNTTTNTAKQCAPHLIGTALIHRGFRNWMFLPPTYRPPNKPDCCGALGALPHISVTTVITTFLPCFFPHRPR